MKQSESVKELLSALVKAQVKVKNLYPEAHGYGYNYVQLNQIIDMLKETLPEFGLSYTQLPCSTDHPNEIGLTTRIIHESGEWLEETATFPLTEMKGVNNTQKAGAAITYARRYALCAAFNITGDEDVDCNDKAFKKTEEKKENFSESQLQNALQLLEQYVNKGVLDKDAQFKKRALDLLSSRDYESITKCITFCKSLEKSA